MLRLARPLMVAGVLAIVLGARELHVWTRGDVGATGPYLVFAGVMAIVALAIGLPSNPRDWQPAIFSAVLAMLIGVGLFAFVRLLNPQVLPRFVLIVAALALVPWYVFCWRVALHGAHRSRSTERVLAVVSAEDAKTLEKDAAQVFPAPEVLFTLVRALTPEEMWPGRLSEIVDEHHVTLVVLGTSAQADEALMSEVEHVHRAGVRMRTLEMFYDEWLGKLPLSEVPRMALLTDIGGLHTTQYTSFKRLIDMVFALVGLVPLLVAVPFVWLGNRFANRGPLLFTQLRTGLNDKPFRIVKFRTMAESGDSEWTATDDRRVTPFGRLLRKLHLDELPQVINVLEGSLSIVGPRPEQVDKVNELEEKLSYYSLRHLVKPGLTGWAQVKFRYGASERDAWEKLQYDLYYIRHQSLTFDLRTISRTIRQVIFAQGR